MRKVNSVLIIIGFLCSCTKKEEILEIRHDGIFFNNYELTEATLWCEDECLTRIKSIYNSNIGDSALFKVFDKPKSGIFIEKQLFINDEEDTIFLEKGGFSARFLMQNSTVGSKFSGKLKIFSTELNLSDPVSFDRIKAVIPEDIELRERNIFNSLSFQLNDLYTTFFFENTINSEIILVGIVVRRFINFPSR